MGRHRRIVALGAGILTAASLMPSPAQAKPPRRATIVEGVGMAGVRVGSKIALDRSASRPRVTSGPMSSWGPVHGFCFEGSSCAWLIPGGGQVLAEIGTRDNRLSHLTTSGPEWRTRRGVGPGTPVDVVRRRYRGETRKRSCEVSPYGAEMDVVVTAGRTTAFAIKAGRVAAVWVVASKIPRGSRCR